MPLDMNQRERWLMIVFPPSIMKENMTYSIYSSFENFLPIVFHIRLKQFLFVEID